MSDGNIENSWVVEVTHDDIIGICTDDIFKANEYNGFEHIQEYQDLRFMGLPEVTFSSGERISVGRPGFEVNVKREFRIYPIGPPPFGRGIYSNPTEEHTLSYVVGDTFFDYIKQINDLPEDTVLYASEFFSTDNNSWAYTEHSFDTQEAAEEFVNNFEIAPIATINNDDVLCKFSRDGETEGHSWTQHFYLRYSGDTVKIYTLQDWLNFFATLLGTDGNPFAFGGYKYRPVPPYPSTTYTPIDIPADEADEIFPMHNCSPSVDLKSIELITGVIQNRVIINYNPSIIDPTNVTVTSIIEEGTNRIENGNGSVAVYDNGNIIMSNDGGTFFLNEFGNVGFFANGDASLTANAQVQLGVGATTVTVENDGFTFRDGTGNVELTADDLTRLKALLD